MKNDNGAITLTLWRTSMLSSEKYKCESSGESINLPYNALRLWTHWNFLKIYHVFSKDSWQVFRKPTPSYIGKKLYFQNMKVGFLEMGKFKINVQFCK